MMRTLLYLICLSGLIVGLARIYPDVMDSATSDPSFIKLGLMLAFVPLLFAGLRQVPIGGMLKMVGAWALIAGALAALYVNLDEIQARLRPSQPMSADGGVVSLRRANDGHYQADVRINGQRLRMMIDTGASMVAIPYEEAERLGVDVDALTFNRRVETANGVAYDAPTKLDRVAVGDIVLRDVRAGVASPGGLDTPLLGMSFLNRLQSYSFAGETLTLKQR